jgi:hypothetical protein
MYLYFTYYLPANFPYSYFFYMFQMILVHNRKFFKIQNSAYVKFYLEGWMFYTSKWSRTNGNFMIEMSLKTVEVRKFSFRVRTSSDVFF